MEDQINPELHPVFTNLRLLLSTIIELEHDGEPREDRARLFLGTKYHDEARLIFNDMWREAQDFYALKEQLFQRLAKVKKISAKRIESIKIRVETFVDVAKSIVVEKGVGSGDECSMLNCQCSIINGMKRGGRK